MNNLSHSSSLIPPHPIPLPGRERGVSYGMCPCSYKFGSG
jgi:hypothetical protein